MKYQHVAANTDIQGVDISFMVIKLPLNPLPQSLSSTSVFNTNLTNGLPHFHASIGLHWESHLVMYDSWQPHGLYSPWNSLGQITGSRSLLQGIFLTQGSGPRV